MSVVYVDTSNGYLPDSRLREKRGTVVVDWPVLVPLGVRVGPNGRLQRGWRKKIIKLELEPIHCWKCGKPNGYCPVDIMSFSSWLCQPCAWELHEQGYNIDALANPDARFWNDVTYEMERRFGRALTSDELWKLGDQGKLGTSLDLLARESPYKSLYK